MRSAPRRRTWPGHGVPRRRGPYRSTRASAHADAAGGARWLAGRASPRPGRSSAAAGPGHRRATPGRRPTRPRPPRPRRCAGPPPAGQRARRQHRGRRRAGHPRARRRRGAPPAARRAGRHGWLVADAGTGAVLAARDPHGRYYPASTLKTLTLLTLAPLLDPAAGRRGHRRGRGGRGQPGGAGRTAAGTRVGLLFQALILQSGNDAANALARAAGGVDGHAGGDERDGRGASAPSTPSPATPSGLDVAGQSSSPYDLALILRAAGRRPGDRRGAARRRPRRCRRCRAAPPATRSRTRTRCAGYPGTLGGKTGSPTPRGTPSSPPPSATAAGWWSA